MEMVALLAELLELLPVYPVVVPLLRELGIVALESFLQQRIRVARLSHLCQERLLLLIDLEQSLLDLIALLPQLLELLLVRLVFSALLSQLPRYLLEFFLHRRVCLADLLPLVQKQLLLLLGLR